MTLRATWSSASSPFSAVPASYAPTTRLLKSSMSTTLMRISSASSSTGTSNSFISCSLIESWCGLDGVCRLAFTRVGQHHISRNFHQFTIAARYRFDVVLNHAFAAFAEVLSQCLFDALEEVLIADAALLPEWGDAQENAEKHDALHALLQVGERRHFFRDLDRVQREHTSVFLDQVASRPGRN